MGLGMYFTVRHAEPWRADVIEAISERIADIASIGQEPYTIDVESERDVDEILCGRVQLPKNADAWAGIGVDLRSDLPRCVESHR